MNKPLNMMDVIRAGAEKTCTPCLLLPNDRTEVEARADRALRAAKTREFARNNPTPSCKWSQQHLTSQYGNWCSMCGADALPPPHFYPSRAQVIEFPLTEDDAIFAGSRL